MVDQKSRSLDRSSGKSLQQFEIVNKQSGNLKAPTKELLAKLDHKLKDKSARRILDCIDPRNQKNIYFLQLMKLNEQY